jgi:hypothetical protein
MPTTSRPPGHAAFHISLGKEQLMISGDAAYVRALYATFLRTWQDRQRRCRLRTSIV